MGPGNMSHCMASSFHNHLDHCFVVAKRYTTKLLYEKNARLRKENQHCLEHQSVRGSYSARVTRSSVAEVHREFIGR